MEEKAPTAPRCDASARVLRPAESTAREIWKHNTQTNPVSNISGKGRAVKQDQDFSGYSGAADGCRLH